MRKCTSFIFIFLAALLFLEPSHAFDHGSAPTAAVVCNFATGNCAGIGGGSSLFTAGTCNGSTNDGPAFTSFNSWAVGTWQASHSGQIQLVLPASTCLISGGTVTCNFNSNQQCPFINIKNLLVTGQGSANTTLKDTFGLISLGGLGLVQDNRHSVPIASVTKGNSCATLLEQTPVQNVSAVANDGSGGTLLTVTSTTGYTSGQRVFINNLSNGSGDFFAGQQVATVADMTHLDLAAVPFQAGYTSGSQVGNVTSIYSVGEAVAITGFDLQGVWETPGGFPPNAQFWEHRYIQSINTGTGVVCFTAPLVNTYLSTWPRYNYGNQFEVDAGGPATMYALDSSYAATVEFDNMTINDTNGGQVYAKNDTVIYRNVVFPSACAIPTENTSWQAYSTDFTACLIEVDKLIDSMVTSGDAFAELLFQSSDPALWTDTGSTISSLQGSPLVFVGNGTIFSTTTKPGAIGYGRTNSWSCTNCSIAGFVAGGVNDNGLAHGVQNTYTMSSGTIKMANGTRFQGVTNNAGAAELAVESSAGWTTGEYLQVSPGDIYYPGVWQVTVNDATHLTLNGSTFNPSSSGDGGWICATGFQCAATWSAPGTNIQFTSSHGIEAIGQVTSVTQDATFTYVNTTFSGGFPSDVTGINAHPAPIFNCPGCTGSDIQIASLAQAPANAPLYSFQTYTYPGTVGTTPQNAYSMWGALSNFEINVTIQSSSASQFHLSQFDNNPVYVGGSFTTYGPSVAAGTAADRKVNSAGSCTGCQAGDSMTTPSGLWFAGTIGSSQYATAPSAGTSVKVTIQTNQGVVNP